MVFKQLELSGFKSFADKTTLLFEPGVTAIVGPNGSGKSNLVDGIKWVLGEQSARELRGGRMEDLIFNGTDTHPPLNVAEVSLTFDNSAKLLPTEYEEVMITRRLYRSGESEYLLNKTPVRLKDITELLMGTGIGTSAYSLFEQGKIDQLIHARPEERRAIFEEAAGITKYKAQKREALRKLEQTEANLLRLSDVTAEVRRQLSALERQVKKARIYREQWERLKSLEVILARREFQRLERDRQRRQAEAQGIRDAEGRLQQAVADAEQALATRRAALEEMDRSVAQAKAQVLETTHAIEMESRQSQAHRERIAEGRERAAQAAQELVSLRQQLTQTLTQIGELCLAIESTESERQGYLAALQTARDRLAALEETVGPAQTAIRQRKGAMVDMAARASRLRNDLMKRSAERHAIEARLQRLDLERTRVSQEQAEAAAGLAAVEETLTAYHAQAQPRDAAHQAAVVAQAIHPKAGAEQAVAAALAEWAEGVVAEHWETAARCAASLRSAGQDRAMFLVRHYRLTELAAGASDSALAQAIDAAERQAAETQAAVTQAETQRSSLASTAQKLQEEQTLLASEREEATQQLATLTAQETEARQALTQLEQQEAETQAAIGAAQQAIEAALRDREAFVLAVAQAQAQLDSVGHVRESHQHSLRLLEQSQGSMETTIAAREAEIATLTAREATLTHACTTLDQEVAVHRQGQAEQEQALQAIAAERATLAQEIARDAAAVQAQARELEAIRQQLHSQELGLAQLGYQQESLTNRLKQVYQLDADLSREDLEAEQPEPDWDRITQECDTLRQKLEGLGPVSLASIDESKELEERLAFLTREQADLVKAKDDLHEVITKINRTTRAQFKETFQKIQQEFQETFRTLFEGGEARLVLLDEEDLLESGIEVIARPPGKTPQAISLLSGGEKALTSIALLFAIFRVRPSPFCVLDEIDAPLDEANIDRFTRALKSFLKDSQFIVITHNKKTITMADVMYGVTMEEQGVSKIVSVKLQETSAS